MASEEREREGGLGGLVRGPAFIGALFFNSMREEDDDDAILSDECFRL